VSTQIFGTSKRRRFAKGFPHPSLSLLTTLNKKNEQCILPRPPPHDHLHAFSRLLGVLTFKYYERMLCFWSVIRETKGLILDLLKDYKKKRAGECYVFSVEQVKLKV
jgi:hypothetical protein